MDDDSRLPWDLDGWTPGDQNGNKKVEVSDSRSATSPSKMPPRRRVTNAPKVPTTTIDLHENDMDDPDYLELLKIYEESDSDTERENFIRERQREKHGQNTPLVTQGAAYMIIICCVGFFILFVNYYNVKQLERLKQEYGLDDKKPEPELWWKKSLMYRIYVQSFKDSDGDGIGDLQGIRQHIDYLHYLHVDAVILNPIFESPMIDQGKDISDFKVINSKFGTMEVFNQLVEELHQLGIKIILEFVPNHTSRFHKWFRLSRKGGSNNSYKDYYVWHGGRRLPNGTREEPSNWLSKYGGSAWTWDNERLQFYYHYHHSSMPDLNHREVTVREEFTSLYKYWLEKGVDGILADGVHALFEAEDLSIDEPLSEKEEAPNTHHESLDHLYTEDQPEVHEYLGSWRDAIDEFGLKHKKKVPFFVYVEDPNLSDLSRYYYTGADAPLTPSLTSLTMECGGICIHDLVDAWISHVPSDNDVFWMTSSADHMRGIQYKGVEYQSLFNMLMLLLPGVTVTYYGEELGMDQLKVTPAESKDILTKTEKSISRDRGRSPMQWNSQQHAGFTEGENPWLPVHPNYETVNVEKQQNEETGTSTLQLYQRLASLRKYPSFQHGKLQYSVVNERIFSFLRFAKDNAPYLIVLNFGKTRTVEDFSFTAGVAYGKVVAHAKGKKSSKEIVEGEKINITKLPLEPAEGVVLLLVID